MTLKELGNEYLKQGKILERAIERKKREIKTLKGEKQQEALKQLRILREMKNDCKTTAFHLIHYYNE